MVNTFHKDHPEKPTVISVSLNSAPPIARPIVKPTNPLKQKRGRLTGRAKKRAKWGDKKEVTKWNPSQRGSRARSRRVAGDVFLWLREHWGAYIVVDHWQFNFWRTTQHFILIKSLIILVSPQTSPSSNKSLLSSLISVISSLSLVQVGRFFHWQYLHFMIFRFSSPSPSSVGRFFIDWSLVRFSSSVSH